MKNRLSWDDFYLGVARAASLRSGCQRSQVGAVVVSPDHKTFLGYNGSEPGGDECYSLPCPRSQQLFPPPNDYSQCIYVHAECNAIIRCPFDTKAATIYITREPCDDCYINILSARIKRVVWKDTDGSIKDLVL